MAQRISVRRAAEIAITVQFLALVRTLAEIYRLRAVRGADFALAQAMPYVAGALGAGLGAWVATTCYFLGRYRLAIAAVIVTILALLAYKVAVIE